MSKTILCISSYEKGQEFLRQAKREGWKVLLLTSKSLEYGNWPKESLDNIYFIPDVNKEWHMPDVINGVSFLARTEQIDRIVALDDFDVEKAATLREHLRIGGMGETTARYFRDKLAMRVKARDSGIPVPEFVHALNYDQIRDYMERVPPPWVLKPRFEASAVGIKKVHHAHELWPILDSLGDKQSFYVLEKYVPGDVFHVDSIITNKKVLFSIASRYGTPPMTVAHGGGVFTTRTMIRGDADEQALLAKNREVMAALGLVHGVSHTEFIKGAEDGQFYFLETASRVGGANIVELIEAATGMNLWAEWAKLEISDDKNPYKLPKLKKNHAGLLVSLARQEYPDYLAFKDPEIVWTLHKKHHAGLIVSSPDYHRIDELLADYVERFTRDFTAFQPSPERPTG